MAKYLNLDGLETLWAKIKSCISGKQDTVSTDTDLSGFDADTKIVTGFGSNKLYLNTAARLWTYIQNQISSVLGLSPISYGGNAATATTATNYASGGGIADALAAKSPTTHTHSVKINGVTKTIPATGGTAVDLGTYLTSHQDISGKANLANTSQYILSEPNQADASKYLVVSQSEFGGSSTGAWMNYDLVLVIQSRHSGSGIAVIQCNVNTGTPTENALTGTIQVYATNSSVRLSSPMKMYRKYNASTYRWTVTVVVQCSDHNEFQIKSVLSKRGNLNYSTTLSYVTDLSSLGTLIATATVPNFTTVNDGKLKLQLNGGTASQAWSANSSSDYTLSFATGGSNGTVKIAGTDIAVKGLGSLAYKSAVGTGDVSSGTYSISISGNAATANKATQDANGRNIAQNYALKSELPSPSSDVFYVDCDTTSFATILSEFANGSGKKLILRVGKESSGSFTTVYYLPLYRVVFNGRTITQFVWMLDSDAYGDASGGNTYGAIYIYKVSEAGWSSSSDNVEYAKAAGTAYGGTADYLKFLHTNEINFKNVPTSSDYSGRIWFNYRNGDTDAADSGNPATDYFFGNRNKGYDTTLHANRFAGSADKWNGWSIVVGSIGTDANTLYFV